MGLAIHNGADLLIPKLEAGKLRLAKREQASGFVAAEKNLVFEGGSGGVFSQVESSLRAPLRMAVKSGRAVVFLYPAQVIVAEAQGNYVLLKCLRESHRVRVSIREVETKLRRFGFIRIHRSTIVNASCVEKIELSAMGTCVLGVRGGSKYEVSRSYRENLRTLAPVWLGGGLGAEEV